MKLADAVRSYYQGYKGYRGMGASRTAALQATIRFRGNVVPGEIVDLDSTPIVAPQHLIGPDAPFSLHDQMGLSHTRPDFYRLDLDRYPGAKGGKIQPSTGKRISPVINSGTPVKRDPNAKG